MTPVDSEIEVLARRIHREVVDVATPTGPPADGAIAALARSAAPLLGDEEIDRIVLAVRQRIEGLGPLQCHLDDDSVTEVMVNGDGTVWVEREGRLDEVGSLDDATTRALIERIVAPVGIRVDRAAPMADARVGDGSRVNVVLPPIAVDGPCLTIRRFPQVSPGLDAFCPPPVAGLLRWAVAARLNILVSGATGAGKTTLLGALVADVDPSERIVTVEDAAELRLGRRHVVRLEARPANAEGVGAIRVRELLRNALRMRPDRLVVGEVRGAEAFDMVQALSTGHDGSFATCHANGPLDALRRVEALAAMADLGLSPGALRSQLVDAVDLVVHVARRAGGRRAVVAVHEVASDGGGSALALATRPLADEGSVLATPLRPPRRATGSGVHW